MRKIKKGSNLWAYKKLLDGETLCIVNSNLYKEYIFKMRDNTVITLNKYTEKEVGYGDTAISFMDYYEDSKFDIFTDDREFKVGDWFVNDKDEYYVIENIDYEHKKDIIILLRAAGTDKPLITVSEENLFREYKKSSLNPDFSKAKKGDEVFLYGFGKTKILSVDENNNEVIINGNLYDRIYRNLSFTIEGKTESFEKYSILFQSVGQAKAFYNEMFRRFDKINNESIKKMDIFKDLNYVRFDTTPLNKDDVNKCSKECPHRDKTICCFFNLKFDNPESMQRLDECIDFFKIIR